MITIVDYGVGNLFSLKSSFGSLGEDVLVSGDPERIASASKIVLPGVGAFGDAADKLRALGMDRALRAAASRGTPLLGICLGMQLLFDNSYEYGEHEGLGLIPGSVRPIADVIPAGLKIPHIGWNALHFTEKPCPLFKNVREGECVYFVHSFAAAGCGDSLLADTEYGTWITACVGKKNVMGCQFHPEKSGEVGLKILKAFCEMEGAGA